MSFVPPFTRNSTRIFAALLFASISLLASCARQPAVVTAAPDTAAWDARRERVSAVRDWQLRGRIAVRVEDDAWSASMYWRETPDAWTMRVMAPLGRGSFELSGNAAGVALRTADNRLLRAGDPESLLTENLGWQIPVSGLHWWVRGLPNPHADPQRMQIGAAGELELLAQDGWNVQYSDYRPEGDVLMPGRVNLENGRVRVRIVISEWRVAL
jgi:outer membrane lipoprotein LolB